MIAGVQEKPKKQLRPGSVASLQDLSAAAGVSRRTVGDWSKMEGFPREDDGSISVWKVSLWLRQRERDNEAKQNGKGDESKSELEREKLILENADKRLKLKIRAGEYMNRSAAVKFIRQAFTIFKTRMEGLASECTSAVPAEYRAEVAADIATKVNSALRELGNGTGGLEGANGSD